MHTAHYYPCMYIVYTNKQAYYVIHLTLTCTEDKRAAFTKVIHPIFKLKQFYVSRFYTKVKLKVFVSFVFLLLMASYRMHTMHLNATCSTVWRIMRLIKKKFSKISYTHTHTKNNDLLEVFFFSEYLFLSDFRTR